MMRAMELGDKCTADKIKSLIRNFHPDSPVPISIYIPSSEDDFTPNISPPSSSNSDSPMMPRSSKPGGSKRRASRASHESLLNAQTTVDSDVEDYQRDRLHFLLDHPCSFDTEVNVVGEDELRKYRSRFEIPDSMTLMLPSNRVAWNPPENTVAIYGAMLSCGVTLPLQPFIARFLAEAQIAPAQPAPNSYRILMCLGLIWKLKGYETPTPREIHHFYTLRQAGNSGTYFLLSSLVENWIPEGVANLGQVEISGDEKKKGFIWGFPTSNKRWKNSWFFVGGKWGRDVSARGHLNLAAKKVPRHFTSPDAWSKATPVLLDAEISRLAAAAVLPLDERGRPFLLDEDKMIDQRLFSHLPARLPHRHYLKKGSSKSEEQHLVQKSSSRGENRQRIASLDGGDPSDGEEAGDITEGGVESGQPPVHTEAAANTPAVATPSRKGKEKVGVSGGVSAIPIFDVDVPETPLDPASDLAPRANRGKRPAEGTPDHAARPPKRASRVVQYVVSSNEEGANAAVPSSEEADESHVPASTPPQTASPPVAMGEPDVSSGQPQPSGRSESADRPRPSKQPGVSASGSGVAHEAPPMGSNKAGEGTVSFSNFSATEICSHLINNDKYIGEGWEHVKGKPCNRKMEFFFNCHSLMSELVENYKYGNKVSREIKCLREQASVLAAEKLSAEESYAQQLTHLRDQESLAARLEAERITEEAKEKAEHEALDLRNQLSSRELIFDNLKAILEAEAVDRFKRSPAYDALLLCEFERGMRQSKKFFAMKDHSNEKALRHFDSSLQQHMASEVGSIKEQIKRWKAHCRYNRTEPHPMHLEIPCKRAFNTYYSGQKGSFSSSGAEPDLGPVAGRNYGPFMPDGDEEVTWPSEEEIEDEEDSEGPPAAS
ncbi:hypothetical protein LWI29_004207 [Acer saccharum]|uniref:Uncharacterized protein n=1 Tax=Acer saccharum TaxID=4024 RepID=A0AA39VD31_ACESA|nr:hypothetical protein LWI29_004207 [Acer saccharum]